MGHRRGLNCTFSYVSGKKRRVYRVRCNLISYGHTLIASETQAREKKAFYPRKTAPTQFTVGLEVVGYAERRSLNRWLMRYVNYILDPALTNRRTPEMTVSVPARNFRRRGVPISGYEFGDHLASMVFTPQIVFETSAEPFDWKDDPRISSVHAELAETRSPATAFFYPTGTQLSGDEVPMSYTRVIEEVNSGGGGGNRDGGGSEEGVETPHAPGWEDPAESPTWPDYDPSVPTPHAPGYEEPGDIFNTGD